MRDIRVLSRDFYSRGTVQVAGNLLGKRLVRMMAKTRMAGRIVEVEAYRGSDDPASHAYRGRTPRNTPMFGEPGHAYIYFTYGNHYCLNITTQRSRIAGAVLIRALQPLEGIPTMKHFRPLVPESELTNGPGKLTKALGIDKSLNDVDMTKHGPLFVEDTDDNDFEVARSSRVGIRDGLDRMWRFYVVGNKCVSKH